MCVLPVEVISSALIITYWDINFPKAVSVVVFLVPIVGINLFGVESYGEAEFLFSIIKITGIIGFVYVASDILCSMD